MTVHEGPRFSSTTTRIGQVEGGDKAPPLAATRPAARRGLSRFVGRDAEIDQLRRTLQLAGDGHGQVVAIVGEPGVGKSRLFLEFIRSHRAHDWLVLESASLSYGQAQG